MKPCDCKSLQDINKLTERELEYNEKSISVDSVGVILETVPSFRVKFTHTIFRRFCEWYLEDQGGQNATM